MINVVKNHIIITVYSDSSYIRIASLPGKKE
jgi:hypothetical protein